MADRDETMVVFRTTNALEVEFVRNLLAEEGIEARASFTTVPYPGNALMPAEIIVFARDQKAALEVITAYEERSRREGEESEEDDAGEAIAVAVAESPDNRNAEESLAVGASRRAVGFEMLTVMWVIVIPDLVYSIAQLLGYWRQEFQFPMVHWSSMLYSIQWILLISFVVSRSGQSWSSFGVVRPGIADIIFGAGLWGVAYVGSIPLFQAMYDIFGPDEPSWVWGGTSWPFEAPTTAAGWALLLPTAFLSGFSRELLLESYTITRGRQLFGSGWIALLLCSALAAIMALQYGPIAMIYEAYLALILGLMFILSGRLWPVAIASTIEFVTRVVLA